MPEDKEIKVWMIFEVLATEEDTAEESLNRHIENIESLNGVEVLEKEFEPTEEIEKPREDIDKGYSKICETEIRVKDFDLLIQLILNYGPTMVEIMEPEKLELKMNQIQDVINTVANIMHRYLQSGMGGVIISGNENKEQV